jgi:hypothetical protein
MRVLCAMASKVSSCQPVIRRLLLTRSRASQRMPAFDYVWVERPAGARRSLAGDALKGNSLMS